MRWLPLLLAWLVCAAGAVGPLMPSAAAAPGSAAASAATAPLRIATAFDPQTMDPHALALLYHERVVSQIYESLIGRDAQFRIEPALALSWQPTAPTVWRLKLRPGVTFHDGSAFTADDAVFSLERALAAPSQRAHQLKGIAAVRRVDALTLELQLEAPDAVLPDKLVGVAMMSRAWCERHDAVRAQDIAIARETHAVRHANGTGPMQLVRYQPDARTWLRRHPAWWGWRDERSGNVEQAVFLTIRSDAARLAALADGGVDAVLDPPLADIARLKADPRVTVLQTADLGQQYLAMDQQHDELDGSDVQGRNPFRDVRVRRAVYHALNVPLIVDKVLHGQAQAVGGFLSPQVDGVPPELDRRLPYDPARARQLLGEAGYPNGFSVPLDCVDAAWRDSVCQAVAAMLTQVGIRTTLRTNPGNRFFAKLGQGKAAFVEFGWAATPDAWTSLNALFRSHDGAGLGAFNAGRYSNAKLDELIDAVRTEPSLMRRRARIATVLRLAAEDLPLVPLFRRTLNWAMSRRVGAVPWPNDVLELRWVRLKPG